jgi:UDP-galactopyranose mutase
MIKYDYIFIGAGLFNCTLARILKDSGKSVLILEKRDKIGGNCLDEVRDGINVQLYGPHFFHTNNKEVFDFFTKYTDIYHFQYRAKASYKGKIFSFPINLLTLSQLNIDSIEKENIPDPKNAEEQCLATIGRVLYETFFYGYTKKQWGTEPKNLTPSIVKRIPIRDNYIDNYFDDKYQCLPQNGYSGFFKNITNGIEVILSEDYLKDKEKWNEQASKVIYSGKIDEYYGYEFGKLPYRSLRFEHERLEQKSFQGAPVINYTDDTLYTRILEHKFLNPDSYGLPHTVITREFPQDWDIDKEAFYPVENKESSDLYNKYRAIQNDKVIFAGRLGNYVYVNMDQTMAMAMSLSKQLLREK